MIRRIKGYEPLRSEGKKGTSKRPEVLTGQTAETHPLSIEKRGYRKAVRACRGTLKNKEEGEVGVLPSNFINTEARLCLVFFSPLISFISFA